MPVTCTDIRLWSDKGGVGLNSQKRTKEYIVTFDSPMAQVPDAVAASVGPVSIPLCGIFISGTTTVVTTDPFTLAQTVSVVSTKFIVASVDADRMMEDPTRFKVTVQIQPYVPAVNEQKPPGDDVRWRVDLSVDSIRYTEPVNVDAMGVELRIQNGEPVDPPILKEYYDRDYTLSFRSDIHDQDNWDLCAGNVNDSEITMTVRGQTFVFAPKTLKFSSPNARIGYEKDGTSYWQNNYKLQHRTDGWAEKCQAKSAYHLSDAGTLVRNIDGHSREFSEKQFLTENGHDWVRPGDSLPPPKEFQVAKPVDFSRLLRGIGGIV